jgi:hypothetical protein
MGTLANSFRSWPREIYGWALQTEGSTRSCALLRIGLCLTVWTRWAQELLLFRHLADGLWPMCILFFVATTLALVGLFTRISVALSALVTLFLVYYMGHFLGHKAYVHHHTTLLAWSMVWLAFTPCGRSYSVDRWLHLQRELRTGQPAPAEKGNLWGLRLMALQVSSLYLWTAIDKCNAGFLSGARLAHYTMEFYTGSSPIDDGVLGACFMLIALCTRRFLVPAGILLHGVFYTALNVSTFTVNMWLLYLAFHDSEQIHRLLDQLHGRTEREALTVARANTQTQTAVAACWAERSPTLLRDDERSANALPLPRSHARRWRRRLASKAYPRRA